MSASVPLCHLTTRAGKTAVPPTQMFCRMIEASTNSNKAEKCSRSFLRVLLLCFRGQSHAVPKQPESCSNGRASQIFELANNKNVR